MTPVGWVLAVATVWLTLFVLCVVAACFIRVHAVKRRAHYRTVTPPAQPFTFWSESDR